MSELVLLHHNEPMTTSLAIAAGTENEHDSVMLLVRKYANEFREFGELALRIADPGISRFEIDGRVVEVENSRERKGRPTEIALLSEPQATLLITFMRNTDTVRRFKIALVKAFYELRDRLRGQQSHCQFLTGDPSHGADLAVAADRTFRSFMRAGRAAGLPLPAALRMANRQTFARTGMNMLEEIGVEVPDVASEDASLRSAADFVARWLSGELPVPACVCHSADLYLAYQRWCAGEGALPMTAPRFHPALRRMGIGKLTVDARNVTGETFSVRISVPPGGIDAAPGGRGRFYAESVERFAMALRNWR